MGYPGNLRRNHKGIGRRRRALERQQRSDAAAVFRTPGQRIAALNDRLGKGVGATKERERLKRARRKRDKQLTQMTIQMIKDDPVLMADIRPALLLEPP